MAATPRDCRPTANAVAYWPVVSALNEKARRWCQMNARPKVGTSATGARSMLIPQRRRRLPVARPCEVAVETLPVATI